MDRKQAWLRMLSTDAPRAVLLIRVAVGTIFLFEGVQKFSHPAELGVGRFARIGIPWPELSAPFVGVVEVAGGALLLLGLCTRLAALSLVIDMLVALFTTKLPILLGYAFWGFELRKLSRYGFLSMVHEARTDWSMLLGSAFLFIAGAGPWSMDARLVRASGRRV